MKHEEMNNLYDFANMLGSTIKSGIISKKYPRKIESKICLKEIIDRQKDRQDEWRGMVGDAVNYLYSDTVLILIEEKLINDWIEFAKFYTNRCVIKKYQDGTTIKVSLLEVGSVVTFEDKGDLFAMVEIVRVDEDLYF